MIPVSIDIEQPGQLLAYLRASGRVGPSEQIAMRTLAGGVSNRTVLVARPSGEAWVIKQALPKLRVKVDWLSDPARIHKEALGLYWLAKLIEPESSGAGVPGAITQLVFEDHQYHLLAMQAVPQPHENLKDLLLAGKIEPDYLRQFAALLGEIHRQGYLRRAEVAPVFHDRSFFESLRLEPFYEYAAARVPAAARFMTQLLESTRAIRLTVVHGDYSPKNLLVHQGRVVLLDHEVIHFGDPAFDVGFAFAHLLSKAHHLLPQRDGFANGTRACWQTYMRTLGDVPWSDGLEPLAVQHTLACLLARVAGRSTLEYLSPAERVSQQKAVVSLMAAPPRTIDGLINGFLEGIGTQHAQD